MYITALFLATLPTPPVAAIPAHDLWNAILNGNLDAAATALKQGADINAVAQDFADDDDPDIVDMSMLMLAIAQDASLESLAWLLEHGADIQYTMPAGEVKGASALFVAEYFGYEEAAQLLKDAGAALSEEELRLQEYRDYLEAADCTRSQMEAHIGGILDEFRDIYGFYPVVPEGTPLFEILQDIGEFRTRQGEELDYAAWGQGEDCWWTPMEYQSDGAGYTLISYGADQTKGGSGELEADIVITHHKEPASEPQVLSEALSAIPADQPKEGSFQSAESLSEITPQDSNSTAEVTAITSAVSVSASERREFDPVQLPGVWNTYKIRKDALPDEQAIAHLMAALDSGEQTLADIIGAEEMERIPPGTTEFLESGEVTFALTDYMTYDTLISLQVTGTWKPVSDNALTVNYTVLDDVKMTLTDDVPEASQQQRQPDLDKYAVRFKEQTVSDPEFSRPRTWSFLYIGETYWLVDMEDHRGYFVYRRAPESRLNPQEISAAIVTIYHDAITEVAGAVKDYPEAAGLQPVLAGLKNGYIWQLVELGKQREALSDEDKANVDLETRLHISRVPAEAYQTYSDAISHYFEIDQDVWKLLRSFNIITQYAFFELLKEQEPEEAQRLGIE